MKPKSPEFDTIVRDLYLKKKSAYAVIKRVGGYKN
jgi:hypothetical protein